MAATKLEDIYANFPPTPISIEDFDEFYVPADEARGLSPLKTIIRKLQRDPGGSSKLLFAGYKGCGKSTELVNLQKQLEAEYIILKFSVIKELDINNFIYIELFIVAMEKLFECAQEYNLPINEKYLVNVLNWMKTKEIEEISDEYLELGVEAGAGMKADIPFIASFFAKFKSAAKTSSSLKEKLISKVEPKLSELILNCNLLINEIKLKMDTVNKKGLIIIFEDLDKISVERGEDLFYHHSSQLTQLNAHCIFTYPIALCYYSKFTQIRVNYTDFFELPMIKIKNRDGTPFEEGVALLKKIIAQRANLSLFDEQLLDWIIEKSGGCLLDLFRLIMSACDHALDFGKEKIDQNDFKVGYLNIKADYERTIADNKSTGISAQQYYDELVQVATDPIKKPRNTEALLDLRNNLTVLGYNGEAWCDVHPIVRDILHERKLI